MPRLRHRMRCRRCSRRGSAIRPPSPSPSELTTPSSSPSSTPSTAQFSGRYPATRSGRGRVQPIEARRVNAATQMLNLFVSPHQPHQIAQFHFHCTMNRPAIITTISVAFREETRPQNEQTHTTVKHPVTVQPNTVQEKPDTSKQKAAQDKPTSKQKASGSSSGSRKRKGTQDSAKHGEGIPGSTQAVEDDWDEYRCLVGEEPTPPNDT